jgi:hypothetical protein
MTRGSSNLPDLTARIDLGQNPGTLVRFISAPDHPRMKTCRPVDRDTGFLMPPSVDDWLPARHLARFVVDAIAGLDLRSMTGSYCSGSDGSCRRAGPLAP